MLEFSLSQNYFMYELFHVEKCLLFMEYCELVSTVAFIFIVCILSIKYGK